MTRNFLRRRVPLLPKIGEIFSAAQSGNPDGFGFYDEGGGDDDNAGGDDDIHGIQTETGIDIETEGGIIIQAENQ